MKTEDSSKGLKSEGMHDFILVKSSSLPKTPTAILVINESTSKLRVDGLREMGFLSKNALTILTSTNL